MRVLIVTAVYPPEPVVSARLSCDLKAHLESRGHGVHVLCPQPSRGAGPVADSPEPTDITRLDSYHCADSRLLNRARESWDFGRQVANWLAGHRSEFDVIYANMWPIFGPWHLTREAARHGIPVVQHVMDIYPESLTTKLPPCIFKAGAWILRAWDRAGARRSAAVVLLSPRIGRQYAASRGIEGRVHVVRNWVDVKPFEEVHDRREVCKEYEVPADRFTFMYLGNLSALSGLETAIQAFQAIASGNNQLVIVGEGSAKASCMALARELGLQNVLFRSDPDAMRVARIQTMADVFLLPTRRGGALSSTPSKCISYMLSGKPILAAVDNESDLADDLRNAGCGWLCPPEEVGPFADAMGEAQAALPERFQSMGGSGRAYALVYFSREKCLGELAALLEMASQRKASGGGL
ncbi:MAG TPA: hypothetical protein DCM68_05945 [Verrucomicrobia bacterium]|nr:hypothetical protein [Verrucomicrobiota bacterium]